MDVHDGDEHEYAPLRPVVLTLPADTRMARVARLAASALGSLVDFSVDDIDDLRIGVDEMVVSLIELGCGDPLTLSFDMDGDVVRVTGQTVRPDAVEDSERFSLSERILAVVSDEYELSNGEGVLQIRLVKRASTS